MGIFSPDWYCVFPLPFMHLSLLPPFPGLSKWRVARSNDLFDLLEMDAEREARLKQIFCSKAGNETGGLDLEEKRVRFSNVHSAHLLLRQKLPESCCWSWGLG